MAASPASNPFARLDTSLMRSTRTQEASFPGTQETVNPLSQEPRNPALQEPRKPVSQESVKPGTQGTPKRATYPKQTFNIHPDIVDMLEEAKRLLRRQHAIKTSKEEITEIAIEQLCLDFQHKKENSVLIQKLRATQEPRNL